MALRQILFWLPYDSNLRCFAGFFVPYAGQFIGIANQNRATSVPDPKLSGVRKGLVVGRVTPCAPFYPANRRRARSDAALTRLPMAYPVLTNCVC